MKMGLVKVMILGTACLLAATAQAIPISGNISFGGTASLNGALDEATAFTAINAKVQFGASGSYAGVPAGTIANFTPFVFVPVSTVTPLWMLTVGTVTYSFDATSMVVSRQDLVRLNISGQGIAHIVDSSNVLDYSATAGNWSITVTSGQTLFTFNDSTSASTSVPDSGATLILLGLALSGLALLQGRLVLRGI